MKAAFVALALLVATLSQAMAAAMPKLISLRVYNDAEVLVDDYTGLPLSKAKVYKNHSTIFEFANIVEIDPRYPKTLKLSRVYPRVPKHEVASISFGSTQTARQVHDRLVKGEIKGLAFPYSAQRFANTLEADAEEVILSLR